MKFITIIILIILFISCTTYKTPQGKTKILTFPHKDNYNLSYKKTQNIREIDEILLDSCIKKNNLTIIFVWYPLCGSLYQDVIKVAKELKNIEQKFPSQVTNLFIASSYHTSAITNFAKEINHNKINFIMANKIYGKYVLKKTIKFNANICNKNYQTDIMNFAIFVLNKNKEILYATSLENFNGEIVKGIIENNE